jgi:phosphatidylserine/phosphatidylglycerophosphate/cardiolipin synthase-like enzyme
VTSSAKTYFGGPDKSKNLLRDILVEHIQAAPAGGDIQWVCYYLNDPVIFQALIDASERGVSIKLTIDGTARSPSINQACITVLSQLNRYPIKINIVKNKPVWEYFGLKWHAHLHSKLYYFSHPTPHVLVGSYNPTAGTEHINQTSINEI